MDPDVVLHDAYLGIISEGLLPPSNPPKGANQRMLMRWLIIFSLFGSAAAWTDRGDQ